MATDTDPKEFTNYFDFIVAVETAEDAADDFFYDEPDLDFGFEHDSAMESIGWGDDDAFGPEDFGGEW